MKERVLTSATFQNFNSLRHLDLSKGELATIECGSFLHLPHLLSLNLAQNHIKNLYSNSFEGLKKLQYLNLRGNSIRHIPNTVLHLKNLKALDVSENPLECDCATLKVRDKLLERGVNIPKSAICTGPVGVKGWSLLKPTTKLICIFEEQDEEMQMDQPMLESSEGSGEIGSGDEEQFEDEEGDFEEDADTSNGMTEMEETPAPETSKVETPAPESSGVEKLAPESAEVETPTPESSEAETSAPETSVPETPETPVPEVSTQNTLNVEGFSTSVSPVEVSLEKSKVKGDDGLFFDTDDKSSTESPPVAQTEKPVNNDQLVIPVEGSGDDDDFEGSGTIVPPINFKDTDNETVFERSDSVEKTSDVHESLFDNLFGNWNSEKSTTPTPEEKPESEIVKEEFLPVIPVKKSEADEMLPTNLPHDKVPQNPDLDAININKDANSTLRNVETEQEIASVSSSQETKMGNGSMVVLIVLLAIFVALVGFAAYKGDFCKKKRVRDDPERGTELKDMRKSLLDGGNSVQPKISNGNYESIPLMSTAPVQSESKEPKPSNQNGNSPGDSLLAKTTPSDPSPISEIIDPVKPPRKSIAQEEVGKNSTNGKSIQEPFINPDSKFRTPPLHTISNCMKTPPNTPMKTIDSGSPPLSPDAQRVKIILQDNPDSVPKTPILITRTKMGENLVKTP